MRWGDPSALADVPTSPSQRFPLGPSLSALKGGEGIVAGSGRKLLLDPFQHTRKVVHDVTVPEADHTVTVPRDFARASRIGFFLRSVLATVELDCELHGRTGKIDNARAYRVLTTKTMQTV